MSAFASVCVFAGPSLPPQDRVAYDRVTFLPPAGRGDIAAAAATFDAVLLIDGVFDEALPPSPREVALACERTRFFGASSMGALRAAECRRYGATPLGIIARWYARDIIDGDDEVAVAMHPRTHAALSVASVNVRYVAWLACRRGILDEVEAAAWIRDARYEIFYADRQWADAIELAPARARTALAAIAQSEGDLKRWDARFAVRRMRSAIKGVRRGRH